MKFKAIYHGGVTAILVCFYSLSVSFAQGYNTENYGNRYNAPALKSPDSTTGALPGQKKIWYPFGCKWAGFDDDRVVFHIGQKAGSFKKVQIKVGSDQPYFIKLKLVTTNGVSKRLNISSEHSLPGLGVEVNVLRRARSLRKIVLRYDARMREGDRTKICIAGEKSINSSPKRDIPKPFAQNNTPKKGWKPDTGWSVSKRVTKAPAGQWREVGCLTVQKRFNDDYFQVTPVKRHLKALRLYIKKSPVIIEDLELTYRNGIKQKISPRRTLDADKHSRVFNLDPKRALSVIDIRSRSRSMFRNAHVCFQVLDETRNFAAESRSKPISPRPFAQNTPLLPKALPKPPVIEHDSNNNAKPYAQNDEALEIDAYIRAQRQKAVEAKKRAERVERERLAAEKAQAAKKADMMAKVAKKRIEKAKAAQEKADKKAAAERAAQLRAEAERKALAKKKAAREAQRRAEQNANKNAQPNVPDDVLTKEQERAARESAEAERKRIEALREAEALEARERAQNAREAQDRADAQRRAQERAANEKIARQRAEMEKAARAEAEKRAREQARREQARRAAAAEVQRAKEQALALEKEKRAAEIKRQAEARLAAKSKTHSKKEDFPQFKVSPDQTGWIGYGCQSFGPKIEELYIPVGKLQGTFSKIRVKVSQNSLTLKKMYVVYGTGSEEPLIRYSSRVKIGTHSSNYTLSHKRRFISEVKLRAKARDLRNESKALVCLEAYR